MSATPVVVYVSCAESKEIWSFRLDRDTGALELFDILLVPGTSEPSPSNMPLAFGAGKRVLYAALRSPPFPVTAFGVEPGTGKLSWLGTAPLPAPMGYIAVGGNGRVLLGASYKNGMLSVSRIEDDGAVAAPASQVLTTPPKAHCIIQGRSRNIVYATTVDGNAILIYRLDIERGALATAEPDSVLCRPRSGPRHLVLHPTLDVLYCINETSGTLAAFAVNPVNGALSELQYEPLMPAGFQGNARAADVHITPSGRFIYGSVRSSNVVGCFSIDPRSGQFAPMVSHAVEGSPRGFAIEPLGRFLICASQTENTIGIYAIDAGSGALVARHQAPVGGNPNWVETLSLPVGI